MTFKTADANINNLVGWFSWGQVNIKVALGCSVQTLLPTAAECAHVPHWVHAKGG